MWAYRSFGPLRPRGPRAFTVQLLAEQDQEHRYSVYGGDLHISAHAMTAQGP